jgi:hypothetical protein
MPMRLGFLFLEGHRISNHGLPTRLLRTTVEPNNDKASDVLPWYVICGIGSLRLATWGISG